VAKRRYGYNYSPRRENPERRANPWALLAIAGAIAFALILVVALQEAWGDSDGRPEEPATSAGEPDDDARESDGSVAETESTPRATPTLIYGQEDTSSPSRGGRIPGAYADFAAGDDPPLITAVAAAVIEAPCGALLQGQNHHLRLPPASLTKIATALVAADRTNESDLVTVTVDGGLLSQETDSTVMGLTPGQTLPMRDLIYGMMLPSGNDAAIAIAEYVGGTVSAFTQMMNDKATALGLLDSQFTNPHGLDDAGLYTSAYDMAVLGAQLLANPTLAEVVSTQVYQPSWQGPSIENKNLLLGQYPGSLGVKIGYTDQAGQTIVAAAERGGRRIVVSVLGSQDLYVDAMSLLDWAFAATETACGTGAAASQISGR